MLFGGIEALRKISEEHHGLQRLGDSGSTTLTTGQNVVFSYIPTVTGVLYSILWSYIDSDAKRLEPYIQMRSARCPASNPLLDYVFESAFATLVRALRRRHWTLAAISTTFLLISLILPASQGAIFGIDNLSYSIHDDLFDLSHKFLVSNTLPGGEFIEQARAIVIPNGSELPSWTTADYAASAFFPKTKNIGGNETWTARTAVYYAEPNCRKFKMGNMMLFNAGGLAIIVDAQILFTQDVLLIANVSTTDDPSCKLTVGITIRMFEPLIQDKYLFAIFTYKSSGDVTTSGITAVSVHAPKPGDEQYNATQNSSTPVRWRDPDSSCPNRARLAGLIALDFSDFKGDWTKDLSSIGSDLALYSCSGKCYWATGSVTVDANAHNVLSIDELDTLTKFSNDEFDVSVFESVPRNRQDTTRKHLICQCFKTGFMGN